MNSGDDPQMSDMFSKLLKKTRRLRQLMSLWCREQPPEVFCKKRCSKLIWKQLSLTLFCNKVGGLRLPSLLKIRPQHMCFPVNFSEIFKNTFFAKSLRVTTSLVHSVKMERTQHVNLAFSLLSLNLYLFACIYC